jgi:hypothetical protein
MRPISEATLAVLKSQNLTGQDKFNYELKLEGYEAGYSDIQETLAQTVNAAAEWADYCIRSDGKVLFAYLSGKDIYLKTIESEDVMLSTYDSGSGGTLFYSLIELVRKQCFSLIRLNNGKLLLIINDMGDYTTAIPYTLKVYTSNNGLGTDFVLTSTLHSSARIRVLTGFCNHMVSKPAQASDGSIIFAACERRSYSGYDFASLVIYKSIDNGVTWIRKYINDVSYPERYGPYRSTTIVDNIVFIVTHYNYGTFYAHLMISTDYGETWTINTSDFTNIPKDISGNHYLIDFVSDKSGSLFLIKSITNSVASLYKAISTQTMSYDLINTWNNWQLVVENISMTDVGAGWLSISPRGTIHYLNVFYGSSIRDVGMIRELYSAAFPASSISISKGRGGANTASIGADNLNGALNPKNPGSALYGILGTNKQVIVKQGYGDDLIETFTGMIDGFDMSTWPQITNISLRDNLKKALDQTVTYGTQHTIAFELQPIENIVGYLCYLAGIETGTIEETGIQVAKTFSWESYADCFQFLGDLASFEWGCDEYGKFYFRRDYQPDNMYVAYTFEEGVDIESLRYTIKDDDLYYKVAVFGKATDGTVISYEAPFLDASAYNLMPQKILKIDATEATTTAELKKIAERAIALMQSRTAVVNFTSIGVPWLQVGDFIGVYERSTGAASIYRISALKLDMDSDSFTMSIDAYYYGDSIVPGELPSDTATQTVAPAVNIIPEMTSNIAPSGVARSSSVYTSAYEPWQAFNSTDTDLYWNAITNTGWIEYQFQEKMIVDKYSLKARQSLDYNDAMPEAWTLEGFDGAAWVVLDTRSAQTSWGVSEVRTYLFANTVAYSKYRLNVSANNGYNRLQLEQLAMYYGGGS